MSKLHPKWLNRIGWGVFVLSLLSMANLLDLIFGGNPGDVAQEEFAKTVMGIFSPSLDIRTLILAAIAAFLGYTVMKRSPYISVGKRMRKPGKRLLICSIASGILSLTMVGSFVGMIAPVMAEVIYDERPITETTELSESEYTLYALLGSQEDTYYDVDIFWPEMGYDGHAQAEHSKYKVVGYVENVSGKSWDGVAIEFTLVDKEGNVVLMDGKPVTLTAEGEAKSGMWAFETNVVKAKKLSAQPYMYQITSIRKIVTEPAYKYKYGFVE